MVDRAYRCDDNNTKDDSARSIRLKPSCFKIDAKKIKSLK